jgi:hypothetical protein
MLDSRVITGMVWLPGCVPLARFDVLTVQLYAMRRRVLYPGTRPCPIWKGGRLRGWWRYRCIQTDVPRHELGARAGTSVEAEVTNHVVRKKAG